MLSHKNFITRCVKLLHLTTISAADYFGEKLIFFFENFQCANFHVFCCSKRCSFLFWYLLVYSSLFMNHSYHFHFCFLRLLVRWKYSSMLECEEVAQPDIAVAKIECNWRSLLLFVAAIQKEKWKRNSFWKCKFVFHAIVAKYS